MERIFKWLLYTALKKYWICRQGFTYSFGYQLHLQQHCRSYRLIDPIVISPDRKGSKHFSCLDVVTRSALESPSQYWKQDKSNRSGKPEDILRAKKPSHLNQASKIKPNATTIHTHYDDPVTPRGCCWVMQCMFPPPKAMSRVFICTTSRS